MKNQYFIPSFNLLIIMRVRSNRFRHNFWYIFVVLRRITSSFFLVLLQEFFTFQIFESRLPCVVLIFFNHRTNGSGQMRILLACPIAMRSSVPGPHNVGKWLGDVRSAVRIGLEGDRNVHEGIPPLGVRHWLWRGLHLHEFPVGESCEEIVSELLDKRSETHVFGLQRQVLTATHLLQKRGAGAAQGTRRHWPAFLHL